MKKTYVALLIDSSDSMAMLRARAMLAFNGMIDAVKQQGAAKEVGQTYMTTIGFGNTPYEILPVSGLHVVYPLSERTYIIGGMTAMFDAVGLAVENLKKAAGRSKDASFLVMVVTDGAENASRSYNSSSLNKLMRELQATDRWTFAFQVPRGYAQNMSQAFGIPEHNIREWEQSNRGVDEMAVLNNAGIGGYFNARAAGQGATKSFYQPVTTDLSKVSMRTLKRTLDDVTDQYKLYTVKEEASIKEFVEAKTKRSYSVGTAYYQLMKPEKVQPQKEVLLLEKTKQTIFGGDGARDAIGLPDGEHAKVTPGNHSNYDIFVQSTSTNRKLPRGTKILVQVT